MTPYYDPTDPDPRPTKQRGETQAAFEQRQVDWYARRTSPATVGKASIGMPSPSMKYGGAGGATLGGYKLEPMGSLPAPTYSSPWGADDVSAAGFDPYPSQTPAGERYFPSETSPAAPAPTAASAPSSSPLWGAPALATMSRRHGPMGAVAPGLRAPTDPTPEEFERASILAATGFDVDWGTPANARGLTWNPTRHLYEATNDLLGLPFRTVARDGRYLQAHRVDGRGWAVRWVIATTRLPDAAVPYRAIGPGESSGLDATVAQVGLAAQSPDARWMRGETVRSEDPNAVFVPKWGPPKREIRLSDYAWVGRSQLPAGCPYPYPEMPVPQADYASGRWLAADYVPSIPLPPPFDETPWQCGVPEAPGNPKKGGGPPAPSETHVEVATKPDDSINRIDSGGDVKFDSPGIPSPTGSALPTGGGSGGNVSAIRASLESTQAKESAAKRALAEEKNPAKRDALQREVDTLKAAGAALAAELNEAVAEAARAVGIDRYSVGDTLTKGGGRSPPDLPLDPPKPPPPPGPHEPPAPPPATKTIVKCPPILAWDGKRIPDGSRDSDEPLPNIQGDEPIGPAAGHSGVKGVGSVVAKKEFQSKFSFPPGSGFVGYPGDALPNTRGPTDARYVGEVHEFGAASSIVDDIKGGIKVAWGLAPQVGAFNGPSTGPTNLVSLEGKDHPLASMTQGLWFGVTGPPGHEFGFAQYVKQEFFLRTDGSDKQVREGERVRPPQRVSNEDQNRRVNTGKLPDGYYADGGGEHYNMSDARIEALKERDTEQHSKEHSKPALYPNQAHFVDKSSKGGRSAAFMADAPGMSHSRNQFEVESDRARGIERALRTEFGDGVFHLLNRWNDEIESAGSKKIQPLGASIKEAAKRGFLLKRMSFLTVVVDRSADPCPKVVGYWTWSIDVSIHAGKGRGVIGFQPGGEPKFTEGNPPSATPK